MLNELKGLVCPEFYHGYLSLVKDADLREELQDSAKEFSGLIQGLTHTQLHYSYQPGKWTIAQVIQHTIEAETVFAYRAMTFAREPKEVTLPGFDENIYVSAADVSQADVAFLNDYFQSVRRATQCLIATLKPGQLDKKGVANGNTIGVKTLFYISSGHCRHHMQVIRERYLV